ncbi:MAG: Rrf2 family transcriptional regulator [Elusimicrobia bacterium]|nr:Rrf2 family transcriptional regulator [Elusimicrobiota bacterium]
MRITTQVEYAARVLVRLASLPPGGTLSAEKLSEQENISRDYLDQILLRLRRGQLVQSTRGAQGGYALARPASKISIGTMMRAVEGAIFEEVCDKYSSGEHQCHHLTGCGLRPVWERLGSLITGFLDQVTLDQLIIREPRAPSELMFVKDFGRPK